MNESRSGQEPGPGGLPGEEGTDESRVLAALAYVPFLCFLPYFLAPRDEFARHHARQGFILLVLLVGLGLALRVIEWALAGLPVLGIVIITLARLSFGLTLLGLGLAGALKALVGERYFLPGLGHVAERVPL
jgi:uncharacterized membrane protein